MIVLRRLVLLSVSRGRKRERGGNGRWHAAEGHGQVCGHVRIKRASEVCTKTAIPTRVGLDFEVQLGLVSTAEEGVIAQSMPRLNATKNSIVVQIVYVITSPRSDSLCPITITISSSLDFFHGHWRLCLPLPQ